MRQTFKALAGQTDQLEVLHLFINLKCVISTLIIRLMHDSCNGTGSKTAAYSINFL